MIRAVTSWDNMLGIPVTQRVVTKDILGNRIKYESSNSYIDKNIIYSRHWKTRKLFAVFLNKDGRIKLGPGEQIVSIKKAGSLFEETQDAFQEFDIINLSEGMGTLLKLKTSSDIVIQMANLEIPDSVKIYDLNYERIMGNPYIITFRK